MTDRTAAERIVDAILFDLSDRAGIGSAVEGCDPEIRLQIREKWIGLVMSEGDGHRPWWAPEPPAPDAPSFDEAAAPEPLGTTSTLVQQDDEGNFVVARVLVPSAKPGERLELRAVRP